MSSTKKALSVGYQNGYFIEFFLKKNFKKGKYY
jgi:hypothetical protein